MAENRTVVQDREFLEPKRWSADIESSTRNGSDGGREPGSMFTFLADIDVFWNREGSAGQDEDFLEF